MRSPQITLRNPFRRCLFAALIAASMTCESSDELTVSMAGEAVIPQRSIIDEPLGDLPVTGLQELDIAASPELVDRGYSAGDIAAMQLLGLSLTITAPVAAEFDFLDAIVVSVAAGDLPAVDIARLDPVPPDATTLELDVIPDVDLGPYAASSSLVVMTRATGARPPVETTITSEVVFDVQIVAGGLGCD